MKPVRAADAAIRINTRTAGRAVRRSGIALAMGGVLLLGAACSSSGGGSAAGGSGGATGGGAASAAAEPAKVSAAQLTVTPKDGATDAAPNALQVAVASGKLTNVEVTDKNGKPVAGTIAADGLSWKPTEALAVGMVYKVNAQAKDDAGLEAASTSTFTTLTPAKTAATNDNISDNGTYGVGMIVSVAFSKPIKNTKAVADGITFEASDGTKVKGHWFGSQRLDFRPAEYWKPGTKVTIHYRLKSIEVSPGVYGDVDKDEPFTIGRYQVSTADAASHQMTVKKGDGSTQTIPITAGNDDNPSYNGTMVVSSKEKVTRMNSATVANVVGGEYDVPDVPHAMRLTNSGTYVHGNYWSSAFGKSNASHGCISMQDGKGGDDNSTAGKFFSSSLVGDVVKIVNAKGKQVSPDNGLSGWNVAWGSW
ncbi:Ig-like domain-containing protein [Kitasatospora sp. NPDC048540]|uniref:L,D-transpeptidase n=1 Tax=unclassified Kitasatospora TaxID=2633591 RepID=UPI000B1E283A|nr:Ig-like domain-containing protein [Kitasatospora sp. MBT63]